MKPILCLDFDGVCHSYISGWQGLTNIPDPPVAGLFPFILQAEQHFEIHIFSSRSRFDGGIEAMREWFYKHWAEYCDSIYDKEPDDCYDLILSILHFPDHKPPAKVSLDDRAILFVGEWPSVDELASFKSWAAGKDNLSNYGQLKEDNDAQ